MLRLVRFCVSDRPFLALCLALVVSLSVAHLADQAVAFPIPEHQLDRIRGTNQGFTEASAGSCTAVNVTGANNSNPPPPPGTVYVDANLCNDTNEGFPCIYCGSGNGFITYKYSMMPSTNGVQFKPVVLVECMTSPPGSGTIGTCQGRLCVNQQAYDCFITGAKWPYQNGTFPR